MRAVIAEDLALLRDGLARILRAHDIDVAAAVGDPVALAAALEEQHPDIAIVDVRMPPTFTNEGLVAAIEARARRPGMPVLVLSQYVEHVTRGATALGRRRRRRPAQGPRLRRRHVLVGDGSARWPAAAPCSTRTR